MRGLDHVGRDRDVVVDELGAQRVVGDDAADLRRRQEYHLRLARREPVEHRSLTAQIELAARSGQQVDILTREPAH